MGLQRQPRSVYKGEHDPRVLAKVLRAMVEDGVGHHPSGSARFEMREGWTERDELKERGREKNGDEHVVPMNLGVVI